MPIAFRNKITHLAEKNVDIFFHIQSVTFFGYKWVAVVVTLFLQL